VWSLGCTAYGSVSTSQCGMKKNVGARTGHAAGPTYLREEFRVESSGLTIWSLGLIIHGIGFLIKGFGFWGLGSGFRVQGSGFRVGDQGVRVKG